MTKEEFDKLNDGDTVWFEPHFFSFPILGVVRTINNRKGIWIDFYGKALAHFFPTSDAFYDCIANNDEKAVPLLPIPAEHGNVFVVRTHVDRNHNGDVIWKMISESEVKLDDTIIRCAIEGCNQPAIQIDPFWPHVKHDTRCEDHLHTPIDEKCYLENFVLSPCCAAHHNMQILRDQLETQIKLVPEAKRREQPHSTRQAGRDLY